MERTPEPSTKHAAEQSNEERTRRELVKDTRGVIIGELAMDGDGVQVWRRERLRYPARRRRVHLGRCDTLEAGRRLLHEDHLARETR